LKKNILQDIDNIKEKESVLNRYNLNEVLIGLTLFFLPISLKLNSICLILFFVYNLYLRIRFKTFFGIQFFIVGIVFFIIQFLSFFLSENIDEAMKKLVLFLSFPVLAILFPKTEIQIDRIFRYLLYGVLIIMVYAFMRSAYEVIFLNVRFDYGRGPELLLKYTPHHAYLSLFIIISILVLTYQIGMNKIKSINVLIIPVLFLFLFILPSRTGLLIAFLILPVFMFIFLNRKYSVRQLFVLLLALVVLSLIGLSIDFTKDKLLYAFYEFLNIPTEEKPFYGITTRQKIWESCMYLIPRTPILGFGIGDIQEVLNVQYHIQGYNEIININAHNQYLQNILQYGVILSSIIVALFFMVIRKLALRKEWLLFSIWTITLLFFATESMMNRQWGVVFCTILLTLSCYKLNLKKFERFFNGKFAHKNINE